MTISDILLPYQKTFLAAPQKRKLWIAGRQLGKSLTIAAIMTLKSLLHKNGLSICISTGARAAAEIIRKCANFAEAVKKLSNNKIDYTNSADAIKFSTGSRILSLPSGNPAALRGFSAQCVDGRTVVRLQLIGSSIIYYIEIGVLYEILHSVQDYESFKQQILHRAAHHE